MMPFKGVSFGEGGIKASHQLDVCLLSSPCQIRDALISDHGLFVPASGPDQGFWQMKAVDLDEEKKEIK